jgi:hypothetical protein
MGSESKSNAFGLSHEGKNTLRVFENRVLSRIFGPQKEEVVADWRRLHSEERRNLYASRNVIRVIKSRMMKWAGYVARTGGMRNACKILVRRPEGKRPHGRPRNRWENNLRIDLRNVGWEGAVGLRAGRSGF